jgi:hypothetical protein
VKCASLKRREPMNIDIEQWLEAKKLKVGGKRIQLI